ncbi:MAG TPA: hypothetical protein DEF04_13285, partial [Clostridiales bacterium]|nr:hypothetical protein [Clostridiales bacterium]
MMKKVIESGVTLPIIVILAIFLNFKAFLYSSNLSMFEFCVSIFYLIIWGLVFKTARRNKRYNLILVSTVFWIMTFLTSSLVSYVRASNADISPPLFFVIVLLTPLFGLEFIINHKYMVYILMSIISFLFSYLGVKFLLT